MSALGESTIRMANQIARNFAVAEGSAAAVLSGEGSASEAPGSDLAAQKAAQKTAAHISAYWSPALIAALGRADASQLSPIAHAARALVLPEEE